MILGKNIYTLFDEENNLKQEIKEIILDPATNNRFKSLNEYLQNKKLKYLPGEIDKIRKMVERTVFQQVYYLAHLIYYIMEQSNNWGEAGEQQIKISFCRNLLKTDPQKPLSQEDAFEFLTKVDDNIEKLEISDLGIEEAKIRYNGFKFNILGQHISAYKTADINRILRFCNSDKFLQGGYYGEDKEFIYGQGKLDHIAGYDVIYLEKELARTPNNIVAMAAIIGNREIYIRKESLQTIFAQKWLEIFNYSKEDLDYIKENPYRIISENIKKRTLSYFGVKRKEDLKNQAEKFITEMGETILFHELGHGITQHDILPVENGAIGEGTKIFGENIYTSILEFLADFAPFYEDLKGPIQNLILISKTNIQKATRMYYMYLSDTWFFDTEDEYMYIYSDLMSLILLKYIQPSGQVDFISLEKDINFSITNKDAPKSMFERIRKLYIEDTNKIKKIAENATFTLLNQQLDFKKIRSLMIEQFRENDGFVEVDSYEFLVPYWTNMLGYVLKISDSSEKLKKFIKSQEKLTLKKMLVLSAGRKKAEEVNFDHRKYILNRMKEIKLLK